MGGCVWSGATPVATLGATAQQGYSSNVGIGRGPACALLATHSVAVTVEVVDVRSDHGHGAAVFRPVTAAAQAIDVGCDRYARVIGRVASTRWCRCNCLRRRRRCRGRCRRRRWRGGCGRCRGRRGCGFGRRVCGFGRGLPFGRRRPLGGDRGRFGAAPARLWRGFIRARSVAYGRARMSDIRG